MGGGVCWESLRIRDQKEDLRATVFGNGGFSVPSASCCFSFPLPSVENRGPRDNPRVRLRSLTSAGDGLDDESPVSLWKLLTRRMTDVEERESGVDELLGGTTETVCNSDEELAGVSA